MSARASELGWGYVLLGLTLAAGCDPAGATCTTATADCSCDPLGHCSDDSVCINNVCRSPQEWPLVVDAPGAFACDILVANDANGRIADVVWSDHALGHFEQRGRQTGMAVISEGGVGLGGEVARLRGLGSAPSLVTLACADRYGRPLPGAEVRIE